MNQHSKADVIAVSAVLVVLALGLLVNFLRQGGLEVTVDHHSNDLQRVTQLLDDIAGRLEIASADVQQDVRHLTEIVEGRTEQLEDFDAFVTEMRSRTRDRLYRQQFEEWLGEYESRNPDVDVPPLPEPL